MALRCRNWAFESAALDLALRQAGRSLHDVLGLEPQPVRFVNSLGLGEVPSIEPVRRRLASSPGVRFKLDAQTTWAPALVEQVAATGAVDTIDFEGQYGLEVKDPQALGDHVLAAFPHAYLEDPHDLPEIAQRLADHLERASHDSPIHSAEDIGARAAGCARGERQAGADRKPALAAGGVRALRSGAAADVWRWSGRAGRGPRTDRVARGVVSR